MGGIFGKSNKVAPGGERLVSEKSVSNYNAERSLFSIDEEKEDGRRKSSKKKKKRSSSPRKRKHKN